MNGLFLRTCDWNNILWLLHSVNHRQEYPGLLYNELFHHFCEHHSPLLTTRFITAFNLLWWSNLVDMPKCSLNLYTYCNGIVCFVVCLLACSLTFMNKLGWISDCYYICILYFDVFDLCNIKCIDKNITFIYINFYIYLHSSLSF